MAGIISNAEDSLFTYAPRESWVTFYSPGFNPTFTTTFSDPQLQAQANEICGDDQFCLYDIAATRRTDIGLSTLIGNQEFEEILQLSAPSMNAVLFIQFSNLLHALFRHPALKSWGSKISPAYLISFTQRLDFDIQLEFMCSIKLQ